MLVRPGYLLTTQKGASEPNVPSSAVSQNANSYLYRSPLIGDVLNIAVFRWFKLPTGPTTSGHFIKLGNIINEDTDQYGGFELAYVPQTATGSSNYRIVAIGNGFDGLNQQQKLYVTNRNASNTITTYPYERDKWYCIGIGNNFDDSNALSVFSGQNGVGVSRSLFYGNWIDEFTALLPVSSAGPSTWNLAPLYVPFLGSEISCGAGNDTIGGFRDTFGNFGSQDKSYAFQTYVAVSSSWSINDYLYFTTPQCHWQDFSDPLGNLVYYLDASEDASTWGTNATGLGALTQVGTFNDVTGPV